MLSYKLDFSSCWVLVANPILITSLTNNIYISSNPIDSDTITITAGVSPSTYSNYSYIYDHSCMLQAIQVISRKLNNHLAAHGLASEGILTLFS